MTDVRLEDVLEALSKWSLQQVALKDSVRFLEGHVEEQALLIKHAIQQTQESFGLPPNPGTTLQLVINEALHATQVRGAEQIRTIAAQKDQIDGYIAKIQGMEEEMRESIDRMVTELELPPNRHRTLRNAATEVCIMVTEAKKIIQENL